MVIGRLYTAQRLGDVLRLPWSAYDGQTITLRQNKTGADLALPVRPDLKCALDMAPRTAVAICARRDGHTWKPDHFNKQFARTRLRLPQSKK